MRCATAANVSGGNVLVSGSPPASEMTSGRAVTAIMSRIADDFMTRVRAANSPAYRSMSRAVERLGGNVIPPRSVPTATTPPYQRVHRHRPGLQDSPTSSGARPFLVVITTGVMAHADAGIDFTRHRLGLDGELGLHRDPRGALHRLLVMDRTAQNELIRPGGRAMEAGRRSDLCAIAGALLFAGTLADGGHAPWPGLVAGAL